MKVKYLSALFFCTILVIMSGCSNDAYIQNIPTQYVSTNKTQNTTEDIKKAIMRAGSGLGWNMHIDNPKHITATLYIRAHMAKVGINYDSETYSIKYLDSSNLKYKAAGTETTDFDDSTHITKTATIHRNYNSWIINLDRAIKAHLSAIY